MDQFYDSEKNEGEGKLEFCKRMSFEKYIYDMLLVDYLVLNRDRHGANVEVLRNRKKKYYRLAPLFDHGISLISRCNEENIEKYDVMEDKSVQCYIGGRPAKDNLKIIPKDELSRVNKLQYSDKNYIFEGIENAISRKRQDIIWEMIWRRWEYYEDFCNQR